MRKTSCFCRCFAVTLVWTWKQTLTAALSPDSSSGKAEGYFRFLGAGDDPGDDEPRDENVLLIPAFVHHFDTIGFPQISTDPYVEKDYFDKSFETLTSAKDCLIREPLPDEDDDEDSPATCMVLDSKSGAQLWGTVFPQGLFSGCVPHFLGKSRVPLCLLSGPLDGVLDPKKPKASSLPFGTITCAFDYNGDVLRFLQNDEESKTRGGITIMDSACILPGKGVGMSGLGFTIPETMEAYIIFHVHCHNLAFKRCTGKYPMNAVVQLSGFAHEEVFCYNSLEDYDSASKEEIRKNMSSKDPIREGFDNDDLRFSSQYFGVKFDKDKKNDKHALIVGHVVETAVKTNEITGESFVWALIRTSKDMEIDVVFRKSLLESQGTPMPKVGGILFGYFWLSGVIMLDGANEYI